MSIRPPRRSGGQTTRPRKPNRISCGTGSSNPVPSSRESANFRFLSRRALTCLSAAQHYRADAHHGSFSKGNRESARTTSRGRRYRSAPMLYPDYEPPGWRRAAPSGKPTRKAVRTARSRSDGSGARLKPDMAQSTYTPPQVEAHRPNRARVGVTAIPLCPGGSRPPAGSSSMNPRRLTRSAPPHSIT
jgi:hypothetical protein